MGTLYFQELFMTLLRQFFVYFYSQVFFLFHLSGTVRKAVSLTSREQGHLFL